MQELSYTVSFTTPAFLGNAEQQAQWRTPPFKALLRQWWRIAAAPQYNYDHHTLREAEGKLFGQAHEGDNRKSLVRFRLSQWDMGKLNQWSGDDPIPHPEVKNREGKLRPVGSQLYLGYGPLGFQNSQTSLGTVRETGIRRTAIGPEKQSADLWIGFPDGDANKLQQAVKLMGWFGTLGSRARNGWGSLQMDGLQSPKAADLTPFSRPLSQCLQLDWPHAIGKDGSGKILIWKTSPQSSWREAMRELAKAKIAFRTHFKFSTGNNGPKAEDRHLLAYPVTNHSVRLWGNQGRLGNQVRFKVVKEAGKYIGLIVHLPCKLPIELADKLASKPNELSIWQQVHQVLDNHNGLSRLQ